MSFKARQRVRTERPFSLPLDVSRNHQRGYCEAHWDLQLTEAALPRAVFVGVLGLINGLRGPPAVAPSA
jgi:hypothetical protein